MTTTPSLPDPAATRELTELAVEIAREVATLVRASRERGVDLAGVKSTETDVVTQADLAAERRLRELLAEHRPHDAILGEEGGTTAGTTGLTWVLDPIDGTVNYLYGLPVYAVSVAVVAGEPDPASWTQVAGAVVSAADGRTWSAGRGLGAVRRRAAQVNPARRPSLVDGLRPTHGCAGTRPRCSPACSTRCATSGALGRARSTCSVASGQVDVMYERGTKPVGLRCGRARGAQAGGRQA